MDNKENLTVVEQKAIKVPKLEEEIESLKSQISAMAKKCNQGESTIDDLNHQLDSLSDDKQIMKAKLVELQRKVSDAIDSESEHILKQSREQDHTAALQEELVVLTEKLAAQSEQKARFENECRVLRERANIVDEHKAATEGDLAKSIGQVDDLRSEVSAKDEEVRNLRARVAMLEAENEESTSELRLATSSRDRANTAFEVLDNESKDKDGIIASLRANLESLKKENAQSQQKMYDNEGKLRLALAKQEHAEAQAEELSVLKKLISSLEEQILEGNLSKIAIKEREGIKQRLIELEEDVINKHKEILDLKRSSGERINALEIDVETHQTANKKLAMLETALREQLHAAGVEKIALEKEVKEVVEEVSECVMRVCVWFAALEPNRTEPNRTEPNRTEPNRMKKNAILTLVIIAECNGPGPGDG